MALEIAVDSLDDAASAAAFADRLELCRDLESHGFTPANPLVRDVRARIAIPLVVLIRSSPAMAAVEDDLSGMEREIDCAIGAGADALAFGVLDAASGIDSKACIRLVRACGSRPAVFHRAFDMTPDRGEAIGRLADLGFARVLSAGVGSLDHSVSSLPERLSELANTIALARGRIGVVACGGIRSRNIAEFLRLGCDVHSACRGSHGGVAPSWSEGEARRLHDAVASRIQAAPIPARKPS